MNGRDHVAEQQLTSLLKVFLRPIRNPSMNGKDHLLGRLIHTWQGGIGVGHTIGLSLKSNKKFAPKSKNV